METTATVLTAREVAQQIKFRACLATAVLHKARNKVKDQIRAEGRKVQHFDARTISAMAEELLKKPGEREKMIADCEGWVRELVFKTKRQSNPNPNLNSGASLSAGPFSLFNSVPHAQ